MGKKNNIPKGEGGGNWNDQNKGVKRGNNRKEHSGKPLSGERRKKCIKIEERKRGKEKEKEKKEK